MAAFGKSMTLLLLTASHRAAALAVGSVQTSTFFDPAKNWMGETTLHELFEDDTVDQLQNAGLIKTRENPDVPDRTQYFVVESPADAELIYTECPKKEQNPEWVNSEKLSEEYGDDRIENLVQSGRLKKRQHPDFPEQTQLGKEWISTQSLLEQYGFDKVEELLKGGRVEKRQNPSCPERTQYFVKEESANSAQTEEDDEEVQEPEEANVKKHTDAKKQKHGKAKKRDVLLHKHGDKQANMQSRDEAPMEKDEPKVQKHGKERKHKGKVHKHDDEEVNAQEHKEVTQKHVNKKDADGVGDSDGKEKSAQDDDEVNVQEHKEAIQKHVNKKDAGGVGDSDGKEESAHDDEEVNVQEHEEVTQKHVNKKDADGVGDSDGKEKNAAIQTSVLVTVVAIATSAFCV